MTNQQIEKEIKKLKRQISCLYPYKVYTALLTQSGTDAPVATVLQNTLGGTVVWTRFAQGIYYGTLAAAFPDNKTAVIIGSTLGGTISYGAERNSTDLIVVYTAEEWVSVDGWLTNTTIQILVFPS